MSNILDHGLKVLQKILIRIRICNLIILLTYFRGKGIKIARILT